MQTQDQNPIRINDERLAKYKEIYLKAHGVKLTKEQARTQGMALLRTGEILAKTQR